MNITNNYKMNLFVKSVLNKLENESFPKEKKEMTQFFIQLSKEIGILNKEVEISKNIKDLKINTCSEDNLNAMEIFKRIIKKNAV